MSLPPLAALRAFEAAARHQSFKNAAAEIAVTPTAISHQIRLLEENLGVRLFDRQPRKVILTPAGQELYPVLRDGFASIAVAIERIRNQKSSRSVTVSVLPSFAAKWLMPRLARFQHRHPDIHLHLHTSAEVADLAGGVADAAIRYGPGPYTGLITEPMFRETFVPLCSPALKIDGAADLAKATLLHLDWLNPDDATPSWQRWSEAVGVGGKLPSGGITFSDDTNAIQAAIAGQGVVLGSPEMVRPELESGVLVMPFGPAIKGHQYHFVHTGRGQHVREVAAFGAWISDEIAMMAERPNFSGD